MLILQYNKNELTSEELIEIERKYLRWMAEQDDGHTDSIDLNVLDCTMIDLYGYLLGIFGKMDVLDTLGVSACQFLDFLIDVQHTYHDTPYHSFYHATDAVIVLYYILLDLKARKYFSNKEIAVLLVAAICHDAGHTGYNNDYHVKLNTELAIRYNNISVLESLSVEIALGLLEKHQIISNIDSKMLRSLILATDMSHHYDLLAEAGVLEDTLSSVNLWDADEQDSCSEMDESLTVSETLSISVQHQDLPSSFFSSSPTTIAHNATSQNFTHYDEEQNIYSSSLSTTTTTPLDHSQRVSFACILLHAADISNTVRSWPISKRWSDLIVHEFFRQGDAEKQASLEVSTGMDRDLATQASISLKFGDFVVKPYFEALTGLLPRAHAFIDTLLENREEWLKLKSNPFSTSITSYYNDYLTASRLSTNPTFSTTAPTKIRKVSVPAGTVAIPLNSTPAAVAARSAASTSSGGIIANNSTVKPMPILRTTSHPSVLLSSPRTPVAPESRRNSTDHRKRLPQVSTHRIQI